MLKKILVVLAALVSVYLVGWLLANPPEKFKAGDVIQALVVTNIRGASVNIPNTSHKFVHLQFRRFAGCAICNLHMHHLIKRYDEVQAAGIYEVVVFHSPAEKLLPFQGSFPFDVVADPEKKLYKQFGVGNSLYSIIDPRAWSAISEAYALQEKPKEDQDPEGGFLGLPAEFLIDANGKVVASKYGKHSADNWSVDELLGLAK